MFAGQRALVTGGGTGLGLEISRGLAQLGCEVLVASRDVAHHAPLLLEARQCGWNVASFALDVREAAAVERAAAAFTERGQPIDLLVNNAAGNFLCPFERMSARAWRAVVSIALDGTFHCTRYFGRSMLERGHGAVLNVVATYAWTGMPLVAHSASAKAGVLALTRTLAVEWAGRGVRVNAIAPGPFHSQGAAQNLWPEASQRERLEASVPLGRMARVEEIAAQCLVLLSPLSSYVTGACLVVDGGLSLGRPMWVDAAEIAPREAR